MSRQVIQAGGVVGMVHLLPLPGAANYEGQSFAEIVSRAVADATALADGGVSGLLLQNANDHPPTRNVTVPVVASYAAVAAAVRDATRIPLGVNVLKSDVKATMGIAVAANADFVRLKAYVGTEIGPEGTLHGCAAEAIRLRRELSLTGLEIWADAVQPTSRPVPPLRAGELARWCVEFGEADRVVITGDTFEASLDHVRAASADLRVPIVLGGGAGPSNVASALAVAHTVIVGRYFRRGSLRDPIDSGRVAAVMRAVQAD